MELLSQHTTVVLNVHLDLCPPRHTHKEKPLGMELRYYEQNSFEKMLLRFTVIISSKVLSERVQMVTSL